MVALTKPMAFLLSLAVIAKFGLFLSYGRTLNGVKIVRQLARRKLLIVCVNEDLW